jgi:hypothetical protein
LFDLIARIEAEASRGRRDQVLAGLRELAGLSPANGAPAMRQPEPEPVAVTEANAAGSWPGGTIPLAQPCPHCGSSRLHRSRVRSLPERVRRNFSARRLFRCDDCEWRGWLIPLDFGDFDPIAGPVAPDLGSLDDAMHSARPALRPTFSPRDLH